jgi:uncharacterized protein YlxW (UPF0749 family)
MASGLLDLYSAMPEESLKSMISELIKEKTPFLTDPMPVALDDLTFKVDRRHFGLQKETVTSTSTAEPSWQDREIADLRKKVTQVAAQNQALLKQIQAMADTAVKDREDFEDRLATLEARINETDPNYGAF